MAPVIARLEARTDDPLAELAGIYVVGGASALPVVGRVLRDASSAVACTARPTLPGRSRWASPSRATTRPAPPRGPPTRDTSAFSARATAVERSCYDPIFSRDTRVPGKHDAPVVHRRVYRAVHNIGRYRFVECASLDPRGVPLGDITAYDDVFFPFDHGVRDGGDLTTVPGQADGARGAR